MSKREAILSTALKLLVTNGIHATPVSLIAKEAGTGMGTIYNHFESKEVLINAIYVQIKEEEKTALDAVFEQESPVKVQFERYFHAVIRFFVDNPDHFLFMDQVQASPIITPESRERGFMAIEDVIALIQKGKTEQIIKDIPDEEILQFTGGAMLGYLRWINRAGNEHKLDKTLANQVRMVWDAIKQ